MTQTEHKLLAEKANTFRYLITKFSDKGWADSTKYLPIPFDLVIVFTDKDKQIPCWWTGEEWCGGRLSFEERVLFWKRRKYEHIA